MIVEGAKVTYAGDTDPYNEVGSHGRVVALSGTAAHVQWTDGPKTGAVDLVEQFELVEDRGNSTQTVAASFDAALDMPDSAVVAVRDTYDELGEEGLLNALNEAGHLAMLSGYVEEAVNTLSARVREDISLGTVLAQLESDEADSLVGRVASVLLTDRLGEN